MRHWARPLRSFTIVVGVLFAGYLGLLVVSMATFFRPTLAQVTVQTRQELREAGLYAFLVQQGQAHALGLTEEIASLGLADYCRSRADGQYPFLTIRYVDRNGEARMTIRVSPDDPLFYPNGDITLDDSLTEWQSGKAEVFKRGEYTEISIRDQHGLEVVIVAPSPIARDIAQELEYVGPQTLMGQPWIDICSN